MVSFVNMSLKSQHGFLHLLLTTTPDQQKALLSTVTTEHVQALVEIAFNLPLLTDLGEHYYFVKYLGKQKHSLRYKKQFIHQHSEELLKAFSTWKEELLKLIASL